MRWTTMLACLATALVACHGKGEGDRRAAGSAPGPGPTEARASASGQAPAAEPVPFAPRSAERLRQDSVLRSGSRHRPKVVADTT
jgi:hypothetical protein